MCDAHRLFIRPSPQYLEGGQSHGVVSIALVSEPAFGPPIEQISAKQQRNQIGHQERVRTCGCVVCEQPLDQIRGNRASSTVTSDDRAMYRGSTSSSGSAPTGRRRHIADRRLATARRVGACGQSTAQTHRRCSGRRFSAISAISRWHARAAARQGHLRG